MILTKISAANTVEHIELRGRKTEMESSGESTVVPPAPLFFADALGIALLAAILLIVGYLRSRNRMFWGDEIMGRLTLGQPTWSGLLKFWRAGLDSSGIYYYVFARPWATVFGFGELSLRMFSAAGMALSAALIWITARRYYSLLPVAASVAFVYASTFALRWQLANARGYGVFMAASALVLFLLVRGEDESARRPSPLFLLATFAAYSLLNGSHTLGALYAAAFLGIQLVLDLKASQFRPTLYLAAAASFVVVLFSRANLQATAALGKPNFWTTRPVRIDLIQFTTLTDPRVHLVIFYLLLLGLFAFQIRSRRMPVYVVLSGFIGIDILIFEISRHTTSIYVDRYLMPLELGVILLLCELFTQIREAELRLPLLRAVLPVIVLLLAVGNIRTPYAREPWIPYRDYTAGLLQSLPPGLTVIQPDGGSFIEMHFYQPNGLGHSVIYPTDWPVTLDPASVGGVSGLREMENFKALGIYADFIQPTSQVLSQNHDFLVLVNQSQPSLWFNRRILADPRFKAIHLNLYQNDANSFDIWQVHTL